MNECINTWNIIHNIYDPENKSKEQNEKWIHLAKCQRNMNNAKATKTKEQNEDWIEENLIKLKTEEEITWKCTPKDIYDIIDKNPRKAAILIDYKPFKDYDTTHLFIEKLMEKMKD